MHKMKKTSRQDLEHQIREMNAQQSRIAQLLETFNSQELSGDEKERELDKLTRAIEDQIDLVRETEIAVLQKTQSRPQVESTARIRAKLIIREKEVESQAALCQQEQSELDRLTQEVEVTSKQLQDDRDTLEKAWKMIDEEEKKIEEQWAAYSQRLAELEQQEIELKNARDATHEETSRLTQEIEQLKTEINLKEQEEHELDREINELRERENQVDYESDELLAKEEALKREEEILMEKEKVIMEKLAEAEQKEKVLKMRKEIEGEVELRLKGLLLSEDVYNRKHWEEFKIVKETMKRAKK